MAVQAQYPSNVLLLNRNVQESRDCSLQPQPGGYLEQSHMLFNNGGTINPRKRGREVVSTNIGSGNNNNNNNQYNLQNQSTQLIDLSQLHNHQSNAVSTGLQLSFDQQQQQRQQHNFYVHSSSLLSMLSEDFSREIKRQKDEIDQFLQAQGDQLRRTLAEKRQRHYRALLGTAEETVARRLREKEAEVETATRRNAELEARAAQLSIEAQVWQAKARAQEAAAAQLQAQLQQAIISGHGRVDDCSGGAATAAVGQEGQQAEDAESAYIDPDRVVVLGPSCKSCRKRVASVLLLPCRHLCLCRECDQVVEACPLCFCMRNSSVEVYFS